MTTELRHYVSNAHGYLFNDLSAFFRFETAPAAGFLLDSWLIPAPTQPASR
jgi:phosphatidate phosphatase APP1